MKRHKWFHSLLFRSIVSAGGSLCFPTETCGVAEPDLPHPTTTLPKQKNWEFWHVLHTSVVEVNVLRTCRSLTASFFKNLIWPVPKFHCTESVKISIVHGPKELTWKAKTVTLARRDDMNLESIIFKAHAAMLFAFCSVHLHLNYILHHGSKLKPQLVSLQNMQFLTSCKEDFNNQHPMFMAFLQGSMDVPTSKNPAMNAMFTMSSCIYPNFLLGLGNGNIQSPARVAIKKPPRLSFTGTAHSHHPSCQANNRASWGRDAS